MVCEKSKPSGRLSGFDVDFNIIPGKLAQLGHQVVRAVTGKYTPIHFKDNLAGDDVRFLATMDDGRIDRVVQNGIEECSLWAELVQYAIRQCWVEQLA